MVGQIRGVGRIFERGVTSALSVQGGGYGSGIPPSAKDKLFLVSTVTINFHCTLCFKPDIAS